MELKKVVSKTEIGYATKKEVREKKLKKYIPEKWKICGITGAIFSVMMKSEAVIAASSMIDTDNGVIMGSFTLDPIALPERRLSIMLENIGVFTFVISAILTIIYYIKKKKGSENLKKLKITTIVLLSVGIISLILSYVFNLLL